jgi:tight adherence protein B
MDQLHLRYFLVAGATIALILLCISALMLSHAQKQAERRDKRLASVSDAHQRIIPLEMSAFGERTEVEKRPVIARISWIFGFDPERPQLYPMRWWMIVLGLLVVARLAEFMVADFLGRFAMAAVPVMWLVMCRKTFGYFDHRRNQRLLFEFPDALAMLVRSIRVGIPVMEAIRNVARGAPPLTAAGFSRLVEQVSIGVPMEDALHELARDTGLTEYRFFATTLTLQNQTGGTLSDTLESLADVIRKRVALKAKGKAMTSEARSSSAVLAVLPLATGLLLWIVSPQYIMVLFTTPEGKSMIGLAVIMLACGLLSIHTLIQKTLT